MPPYKWPDKRRIIGSKVPRLDGHLKVSGKAKYSYDRNLPGLLHAKMLRSPYAHARITDLDLTAAEAMPGVKATHVLKNKGAELRFQGDEIAAVAAETEEQARDAVRAIKIQYEILPHVATEAEALQKAGPPAGKPAVEAGKVDEALQNAAAVIEGLYGSPIITHLCLETHGLVAHWKSESELIVYCSTQNVSGIPTELRKTFADVPNVRVVTETPFMGGGFGSKFNPGIEGTTAAILARKARAPVKLMLERDEEQLVAGHRPSFYAKVKAGADKDGKIIGYDVESWGTGGVTQGATLRIPYIFEPPNRRIRNRDLNINTANGRAWRAPGHPQAATVNDQMVDDLAAKLGLDPVEMRLKNMDILVPGLKGLRAIYEKELRVGAEAIGWKERYHPPGDRTAWPIKRGLGCGMNTWGGAAGGSQARVRVHPDGKVEIECGTQDLGTGTTTLVPLVAAEILGLEIKEIDGRIGSSIYPQSGGSGGSTTCGGVSRSVAVGCFKALEKIYALVADNLKTVKPEELEAAGGRVQVKGKPDQGLTWKQACALLGQQPIEVVGDRADKASDSMSGSGVGGVQFADVSVDIETGVVKVNKIVAVSDCGLVMNRLLCESQVYGGVVMGINHALFEERRNDPKTGLMLNPDMEWYKVAGHSDVGDIDVILLDYPERGVIGIGEPPCIPTAGAIANAVANAIGVRAGIVPLTPRRVLEALAKK